MIMSDFQRNLPYLGLVFFACATWCSYLAASACWKRRSTAELFFSITTLFFLWCFCRLAWAIWVP